MHMYAQFGATSLPIMLQSTIACIISILVSLSVYIYLRRRWIKYQLSSIMPTVLWTPRFINYSVDDETSSQPDGIHLLDGHIKQSERSAGRKMHQSSIINILPKMERLNGPYGMYATVYGLTKVVHVGHPLPAREILNGISSKNKISSAKADNRIHEGWPTWLSKQRTFLRTTSTRRRSSNFIESTGITKTPAYNHFKNFSGDGVFTADGLDWKAKRASVIHCLLGNTTVQTALEDEVNKSADGLLFHLKRLENRNAVNVVPLLQQCTIGLIYRIITHHDAFGVGYYCVEEENNTARSSTTSSPRSSAASLATLGMDKITEDAPSDSNFSNNNLSNVGNNHLVKETDTIKDLLPLYLQSVTQIRMIILAQSRSIWYLLPRFVYRLLSPMYRQEEAVMHPIRQFARLTVENVRAGSPLQLLSQRSSHCNSKCVNGVSKDLLDEAITLLFAGQDTSAATLSWTLHLLSLDPIRQSRLVEEVRSTLQDSGGDFVSKAMVADMPYLDAVIKESMRLFPVAPFVVRKLTSDIVIPSERDSASADTILPASTFACIWIYALHRNPKLWHSPEDFLPERWIDPNLSGMDIGHKEPGAYIPFAMGPRNCLGRPLAQVILRVLLARIMNKYSVVDPRYEALKQTQKSADDEIDAKSLRKDMQAGFTVLPSNGLTLKFVQREQ